MTWPDQSLEEDMPPGCPANANWITLTATRLEGCRFRPVPQRDGAATDESVHDA